MSVADQEPKNNQASVGKCLICGDPADVGMCFDGKEHVVRSESSISPRLSISSLPDVANVRELAAFLGISEWSIREQVTRNELPHQRIGGKILFLKPAILRHLGLSDADAVSGTQQVGLRPAKLFFPGTPGDLPIKYSGFARIEGAFIRFRGCDEEGEISYPVQAVAWIEWLKDERGL